MGVKNIVRDEEIDFVVGRPFSIRFMLVPIRYQGNRERICWNGMEYA